MGLFNPWSREEQARFVYHENARFREDLRENKRKSEVRLNLRFWSEWQDLNLRPLPPQGSALPTAPHPDTNLLLSFLLRRSFLGGFSARPVGLSVEGNRGKLLTSSSKAFILYHFVFKKSIVFLHFCEKNKKFSWKWIKLIEIGENFYKI